MTEQPDQGNEAERRESQRLRRMAAAPAPDVSDITHEAVVEAEIAVEQYEGGAISPEIAVMRLLLATEDEAAAARLTDGHPALQAVLAAHHRGAATVARMLQSDVDVLPDGGTVEDGVAYARRLFDWSVQQSEEASVALYSLGSPEILDRATAEIVGVLDAWAVLGPDCDVLDLGCGIGRMEDALADAVRSIVGIDVSENMIAAAQRRCSHVANATFARTSGLDLREHDDGSFDLVLAVDSFPYVVSAGVALVHRTFEEIARVLRPGGAFALLQYAYEGTLDEQRASVAAAAKKASLRVDVRGATPFALWDGVAFLLRK